MGNYLSCSLTGAAPPGAASAVRLVLPNGEVQRIPLDPSPVTVAEVMLEHPGNFVAAAASVRVGGRFAALPADEELEMGGVYVVVPMERVGSVVTASNAGALFVAVTSASRSSGKAMKVVPESPCQTAASRMEKASLSTCGDYEKQDDKVAATAVETVVSMARYRVMSKCRSKKPALETIAEETARLGDGWRRH